MQKIEIRKMTNAITHFKKEYEKALSLGFVQKPISYALYQTWKYYDVYETPRKIKKQNEQSNNN